MSEADRDVSVRGGQIKNVELCKCLEMGPYGIRGVRWAADGSQERAQRSDCSVRFGCKLLGDRNVVIGGKDRRLVDPAGINEAHKGKGAIGVEDQARVWVELHCGLSFDGRFQKFGGLRLVE